MISWEFFLWRLLICSAVVSTVALSLGALIVRLTRQPADRLRLIQLVLAACLITPWLPGIAPWKLISLNIGETSSAAQSRTRPDDSAIGTQPQKTTIRATETSIASQLQPTLGTSPPEAALPIDNSRPRVLGNAAAASQAPSAVGTASPAPTMTFLRRMAWYIAICYVSVVVATLAWWLAGFWRLKTLERSASPAGIELQELLDQMQGNTRRRVRLLVSDRVTGPMTWGLFRPVILVPLRFVNAPDARQLRWSLAHELAHVEQYDVATLLLASATQLVCFYQPFYWWLRRQMSLSQDFLADARAARETGSAEDYAAFLVQLAKSRMGHRLPATLGIIDRKSQLFRRVKMLLAGQSGIRSACSSRITITSVLGTALFCVALSTVQLDADEPARPASTPEAQSTAPAQNSASEKKPETSSNKKPRGTGTISGVLINAQDGQPVADATIVMERGLSIKTRSDAQGRFQLEGVPLRAAGFWIWAYKENLATPKVRVVPFGIQNQNDTKSSPARLEMTDGKRIKVTVTSEITQRPVAGATVRLDDPDDRQVKTDEHGVATISGIYPGTCPIVVEAAGHARTDSPIEVSGTEATTNYQVVLKPGGLIEGVVVDVTGQRVPEAEVYCEIGHDILVLRRTTHTDAAGTFQQSFLPLNVPLAVYARKKGYSYKAVPVTLTVKQPEHDLRLILFEKPNVKPVSLSGIVTGPESQPVAGAKITISRIREQTVSDIHGKFELTFIPKVPDINQLFAIAEGFAPSHLRIDLKSPDAQKPIHFALRPGHYVRGRIKLEGEKSPRGATVIGRRAEYSPDDWKPIHVNEDGYFELKDLPEDARFDIEMPGYSSLSNIPLKLDQLEPVSVTLELPGQIRGRVIDPTTMKPIPQFRVRLDFNGSPSGTSIAFPKPSLHFPGLTFASDKGEFAIESLTNGTAVDLIVEAEGYQRFVVEQTVAGKKDLVQPVMISLTKLDPTQLSTLSGRLVDPAGMPKAGAQLRLIVSTVQPTGIYDNRFGWQSIKTGYVARKSYCEQFLSSTTDADGQFEFKHLVPEKYLQLAYWGDGVPQGRSLALEKTKAGAIQDTIIRMPALAKIQGTIDRTKIVDVHSIQISERGSGNNYVITLAPGQTSFQHDLLTPGEYYVSLMPESTIYSEEMYNISKTPPLAQQFIQLQAGETKQLNFTEPGKTQP